MWESSRRTDLYIDVKNLRRVKVALMTFKGPCVEILNLLKAGLGRRRVCGQNMRSRIVTYTTLTKLTS